MKKTVLIFTFFVVFAVGCSPDNQLWTGDNHIKPWIKNSSYWQYNRKPVLLLGATDNDNLFQNENLAQHLDSLKNAGGNYIRNTMSDRDPGDLHAFYRNPDGKYDLNKWNDEYWNRFENLLNHTMSKEIIVQIEVWDRFDHSRDPWINDPFNPANNMNYSFEDSGLDSIYPMHPGRNVQPFFFTVPGLDNNVVLLKYQQMFVDKLLSISLNFDNILYCIDNETSGSEEWASYWADYIRSHAGGKDIYITEMWDDWDVKSETHKRTLDHPERYGYVDISQNSQIPGPENWKNAQYVFDYINKNPIPVNSTKIYGSDRGQWLDRGITTEHAVNTFFRNILGGFASSRFHRPPSGLGLCDMTEGCIRTIRTIEKTVKFWDINPGNIINGEKTPDEIYMSSKEGSYYVIFFARSGTAGLDLRECRRTFRLRWINCTNGTWFDKSTLKGGSVVEISGKSGTIAVISK